MGKNWDTGTSDIRDDIDDACDKILQNRNIKPDIACVKAPLTPTAIKEMKDNLRKVINNPPGKNKLTKKFNQVRAKSIYNKFFKGG